MVFLGLCKVVFLYCVNCCIWVGVVFLENWIVSWVLELICFICCKLLVEEMIVCLMA